MGRLGGGGHLPRALTRVVTALLQRGDRYALSKLLVTSLLACA